jgi:hypothetical protein
MVMNFNKDKIKSRNQYRFFESKIFIAEPESDIFGFPKI